MPPVVYLLCGLTGSGKTTYARRLEAGGAVRLSVDEEVYARHGRYGVDYPMSEYFERERPVVEELPRRLEHHAPAILVPCPVHRAGGDRRLDQRRAVGSLPAGRGGLTMNLDRPPLRHRAAS
jgi:hypothetical protein